MLNYYIMEHQEHWANLCKLIKNAPSNDESHFQNYIENVVLPIGLKWREIQIESHPQLHLGSRKRMIPDIHVKKNDKESFVIEVKRPSHTKTDENIDQLISYMKQLETPVGIYIGNELEIYYKKLGDGSSCVRLMSLHFNEEDINGTKFVSLFNETDFSIERIEKFKIEIDNETTFQDNVTALLNQLLSPNFNHSIKDLVLNYLVENGKSQDVVKEALGKIDFKVFRLEENPHQSVFHDETIKPDIGKIKGTKPNRGTVQRYAYRLIKGVIEKNYHLTFPQMFAIFGHKNYIADIHTVHDPTRWFMNDEDILTLSDGTRIAVSNQWGLNGSCKPRMDRLRSIAHKYRIDLSF